MPVVPQARCGCVATPVVVASLGNNRVVGIAAAALICKQACLETMYSFTACVSWLTISTRLLLMQASYRVASSGSGLQGGASCSAPALVDALERQVVATK